MAIKKKESKKKKETETESVPKNSRYFAGTGRRKSAVARVRIFESKSKGLFLVNEKDMKTYFPLAELQGKAESPLGVASDAASSFFVSARVSGGGIRGQAEAIQLGLSRALVLFDEKLKKPLRDLGYLTRDDRKVERKKAGLKKARRAPQWKKR